MADPADMIIPLLREMRVENAALHEQTRELIKATLLSKLVTGEFEERIDALERKVRDLERQK